MTTDTEQEFVASGAVIPCPSSKHLRLKVEGTGGVIRVTPANGEGRVRSNHIVGWYSETNDFQVKLQLSVVEFDEERRPNPGSDPGTVPTGWSAWAREHCYRVGKGPYDLKYWIRVAGCDDLDPRIIIDR